jgi:hypothetical protein
VPSPTLLLIAAITAVHVIPVPAKVGDYGLIVKQSDFGVTKALNRLGIAMERKGTKVFARVNHAKGAVSVGMDLAPSVVLIFGSPKMGCVGNGRRHGKTRLYRSGGSSQTLWNRRPREGLKKIAAEFTNSPVWRLSAAACRRSKQRAARQP